MRRHNYLVHVITAGGWLGGGGGGGDKIQEKTQMRPSLVEKKKITFPAPVFMLPMKKINSGKLLMQIQHNGMAYLHSPATLLAMFNCLLRRQAKQPIAWQRLT